jgi:hypothetical protein
VPCLKFWICNKNFVTVERIYFLNEKHLFLQTADKLRKNLKNIHPSKNWKHKILKHFLDKIGMCRCLSARVVLKLLVPFEVSCFSHTVIPLALATCLA